MNPYYQDDLITLFHGDCREVTEWLDADVLVTDPPYGYRYKSGKTGARYRGRSTPGIRGRQIEGDESLAARDAVLDAWGDRPALVFGTWKCTPPSGTRTVLVWDKGLASGMGDLRIPWKPNHEQIYVLGHGFAGKRGSGVLAHTAASHVRMGRVHPNQKPVPLLVDLARKCPPGVLTDPFAGSGSLGLAARELGRQAVLVEVDEAYCEVIAERLTAAASNEPLFEVVS